MVEEMNIMRHLSEVEGLKRQAIFDWGRKYRWMLERQSPGSGLTALWIGVNPSTADEKKDDPSIRKLYGFGKRLGVSKWLVGNMFAFISPSPKELARVDDPVGKYCNMHLFNAMKQADLVIVGWGSISKVPERLRYRVDYIQWLANQLGKELMCWGTCNDGHPRHPLMLSYDTPLEPWKDPLL